MTIPKGDGCTLVMMFQQIQNIALFSLDRLQNQKDIGLVNSLEYMFIMRPAKWSNEKDRLWAEP